ncbi:MAG: bifunctional DedA family/phosphatase PAP2 family protein [Patescibacteria group bacterium]|nr:bifunctional DedA family/phosphatase PAP2 family protein [Patescibacteria group bacterium]
MGYIHFFSALTEAVKQIAVGGGYVTLFLVMLLEGLPLIGMAIPGHVAIITAGFLAATGIFDPLTATAVGTAGALLGDCASFYLGKRFGMRLVDRLKPHFFVSGSVFDRAGAMLRGHTGKALILGRFNPVTRGLMPFIVGASRGATRSFWIYDAIGTVAWVASSIAIGYLVALGYHAAAGSIGKLMVLAAIAAILIVWGYRFVNARFHVFKRYELFVLALNLASLYGLARMVQDVFAARPFMAGFDVWANGVSAAFAAGASSSAAALLSVSYWLDAAAGPPVAAAAAVIVGIALSARRKWRSAAIFLLSIGTAAVGVGWMKDAVMRVRPVDLMVPGLASDPSFPSGHAAFAAALFLAAAYVFAPRIRSWVSRELFLAACVAAPIAIGLSRLVLNVHWASDVIAGWSLGVFCATGSILLIRYVGALVVEKAESSSAGPGERVSPAESALSSPKA